jgi:hypothetical protein
MMLKRSKRLEEMSLQRNHQKRLSNEAYPPDFPEFTRAEKVYHNFIMFIWMIQLPIAVFIMPVLFFNFISKYSFKLAVALSVCYAGWILYDTNGPIYGRRSQFIDYYYRGLSIWANLQRYFPAQLVKTTPLDPNEKYLMIYHPHGHILFI